MKLHYFLTCLVFYALFASEETVAQRRELKQGFRNGVSVEPLYLFVDGLRVNYERQLFTPYHWMEVSAIGYAKKNNSLWDAWFFNGYDTGKAWGLGMEWNYKYFPFSFVYVSAGAACAHHTVTFGNYVMGFDQYTEDGLVFYEPSGMKLRALAYNRVAGNIRIGFQSKATRRVLVGGYAGIGYVHSFCDPEIRYSSADMTALWYRGIVLNLGFRIGTRF